MNTYRQIQTHHTHTHTHSITHSRLNRSGIRYRQEFADFGIKSHLCGWPDLTEEDFKEQIPRQTLRFMGDNASECRGENNAVRGGEREQTVWQNRILLSGCIHGCMCW